jgi:hypothetical protein
MLVSPPQQAAKPRMKGEVMQGQNMGGGQTSLGQMSPADEKTWSILAHLSVLAALIGLAPLGALVVWLIYKDKSPRVRFHAAQALWYQLAWVLIIIAYTIVSTVLSLVVVGIFMFFLLPLIALVPIIHGCYAAYRVSQGEDYRYPFIADRVDGGRQRVV